MQPHQDRYIPAKTNGGWGVAAIVVGLSIVLAIGAGVIHAKTYKHPTDVTWHAVGSKKAH
jgi:hypothetical protein